MFCVPKLRSHYGKLTTETCSSPDRGTQSKGEEWQIFWRERLRYTCTYLLTPRSTVLLQKLTGFQLDKKFPAFYGTRTVITAFTSVRHLFVSWASLIQSIPLHTNSWRYILNIILPSTPGSPKWSLSLSFPHQNPDYTCLVPHTCSSHSYRFNHHNNIGWGI